MSYYIRVLSPSDEQVSVNALRRNLGDFSLQIENGTEASWDQLLLSHTSGREIAVIERNLVTAASMAEEEIEEFLDEINDLNPVSGADWLREFLPSVKCIYAFQILNGADEGDGWSAIGSIKSELWSQLGGIFQADGEGFSNEDGYNIVWQFSNNVSGLWWMGLLRDGTWIHFEMELSNAGQRDQYLSGKVPDGVKIAS
jgi:hypothetical protein